MSYPIQHDTDVLPILKYLGSIYYRRIFISLSVAAFSLEKVITFFTRFGSLASSVIVWYLPLCWIEILLLRGDEIPCSQGAQERHHGKPCLRVHCWLIGSDNNLSPRCRQATNAGVY